MQHNRHLLAAAWLATAREDLRVATLLMDESPSSAAFHAQQAAEKAVKAACVAAIDDAQRTHVINFLLDELAANGTAIDGAVRDAARTLERYYAPTRYPDALGGIEPSRIYTASDARSAIDLAHTVLAFAMRVIDSSTFEA